MEKKAELDKGRAFKILLPLMLYLIVSRADKQRGGETFFNVTKKAQVTLL